MRPARVLVSALTAVLVAAGCTDAPESPRTAERAGLGTAAPNASPTPIATSPAKPTGRAPTKSYAVGTRTLRLSNGPDRPLPTTVHYPTVAGRFPVVLFSHGLTGRPANYQTLLKRWAAAGFVVVAPAYPHTSAGVAKFDILDVVNQPADASYVLTKVLATSGIPADPGQVAAAGHSAGGITTVGLFTAKRDNRLRSGIVLAGNALGVGDVYSGPSASLLFVHGGRDEIVSYASGRAAYDRVPWGKAMFTLPDEGHGGPYLQPDHPVFAAVAAVTTDFLRWSLYGDPAARARLAKHASAVGTLDDQL
jgi:fermentation-respiration switch protein FrsA (DUF1100 family)